VKKRLDVRIDFDNDAADSITPIVADAFSKEIPKLIEKASVLES
jgi:hypothetical protein